MNNSISIEHIVATLRGKHSGSGFLVHCPAHTDKRCSLSLHIGLHNRLLVYCHAGCSQSAVIREFNRLDLWPASGRLV
jgi:putative DNA primase/helicase